MLDAKAQSPVHVQPLVSLNALDRGKSGVGKIWWSH